MNTDTGEIRRMPQEEMELLNRQAGRPLWTPVDEGVARQVEAASQRFNLPIDLGKKVRKNLAQLGK